MASHHAARGIEDYRTSEPMCSDFTERPRRLADPQCCNVSTPIRLRPHSPHVAGSVL